MYNAPAVTYPVGRCRIQRLWMGWAWVAAGAVQAFWFSTSMALSIAHLSGVCLWLMVGVLAWRSYRATPSGQLCWDGQQWRTTLDGQAECFGRLRLHLDGQSWMLLAWRPLQAPAQWCWAERARDPARWNDLRRAVCASVQDPSSASGRSAPVASPNGERP